MYIDCSDRLQEKIRQAVLGKDCCVFRPECILNNPNTGFKYTARYVKGVNLVQEFVKQYMDQMQVEIEVTPREYEDLTKNLKDMELSLTLTPINPKTLREIYTQDPIIFKMKVVTEEQQDLEKKYHPNLFGDSSQEDETKSHMTQGQHSLTLPYTFYCVEPEAYELRHKQANAMATDADMNSTMSWLLQQFNASEIRMVPPNNEQKYQNLVLPPMQDISTILPYMQQRYGVYSKGLGYYFTNKIFYIFPIFDHDSSTSPTDYTLHIINAPEKYFLGLDRYHNKVDNEVFVASVSGVELSPLNLSGTENEGNTHISLNADQMRDMAAPVAQDGNVERQKNDITSVSLANSGGDARSDMQNIKYTGEHTNVYNSTSELAAMNGSLLATGWIRAMPRLIEPGMNVIYHYDSKGGVYQTQKGRILQVAYGGQTHPSEDGKSGWISFNANLQAHIVPDNPSEAQFGNPSSPSGNSAPKGQSGQSSA